MNLVFHESIERITGQAYPVDLKLQAHFWCLGKVGR